MRKLVAGICSFIIVFGICTVLAFYAQEVQAEELFTVSMKISPDNLVIHSIGEGDWLTAHVDIPYSAVDSSTLELTTLLFNVSIPVKLAKADLHGDLVAKFDLSDVKAIVTPPTETLLLFGYTTDGIQFCASDFIRVK